MSNTEPDKNSSQFYITTVPCPQLDGTHVIVGRVVKGLNIVVEMQDIPSNNDIPSQDILISDCGELKPGDDWNYWESDGLDVYPPWPNDWEVKPQEHKTIRKALDNINSSGKDYFRVQKWLDAERKYKKLLRYIDWYIENKDSDTDMAVMGDMRNSTLLNLTAARLKINKNKEAKAHCDEVIKNCPNNAKAYYRRAKARLALNDYDEALADLKMALDLQPKDKNIRNFFQVTKQIKLKYLEKEKQFYSKVFG